jgi:hypothetical protein
MVSSDRYLAISAIFKDEAPYLREWVEFHLRQGVEHLYLYDNGSSDDGAEILRPFVDQGLVTLIDWPISFARRGQARAASDALERARGVYSWLSFIDIDEFLFSPNAPLTEVLGEFENEVGVEVNWVCYGSSGLEKAPTAGVLASFLYRAPISWKRNRQFKSIVNVARTIGPARRFAAHSFRYVDNRQAVNERRQKRSGFWGISSLIEHAAYRLIYPAYLRLALRFPLRFAAYTKRFVERPVSAERLRINHYVVKSREEYQRKRSRHGSMLATKYADDYFSYHDRNEVFDPILSAANRKNNQSTRGDLGAPNV